MQTVYLTRKIELEGEVIKEVKDFSHSWTRNAYNFYIGQIGSKNLSSSSFGSGELSLKKTDGDVYYSSSYGIVIPDAHTIEGINAGVGVSTFGIQIGTSDQAFSFDDYSLISQVAHGSGSGQMQYQEMLRTTSFSSGVFTRTLYRKFENLSGETITINEIGLVVRVSFSFNGVGGVVPCLFIRDVLPTPDDVPDTGQFTVIYTFTVEFPN